MKYSIIVPVYNCALFLNQCIDSVISQTVSSWELILIDDGSNDDSCLICDNYADKLKGKIRVIHKSNEGVAIARKLGCDLAQGKYVVFVDSDDWLEPSFLSRADEIIYNYDVEVIRFSYVIENNISTPIKTIYQGLYNKEKQKKEIYSSLIRSADDIYYPQNIWGCVFSKQLLQPYMLHNSKATLGEDGATIIPTIFHSEKIYFDSKCLYHYRFNNTSITKSCIPINWDNPEVVNKHIESTINVDSFNFREQLYRKIVHDLFNVSITQFYKKEKYSLICHNIGNNLDRDYYHNAIQKAHFSGRFSAILMLLALKFRLYFLLYLYSIIKKFIKR